MSNCKLENMVVLIPKRVVLIARLIKHISKEQGSLQSGYLNTLICDLATILMYG